MLTRIIAVAVGLVFMWGAFTIRGWHSGLGRARPEDLYPPN